MKIWSELRTLSLRLSTIPTPPPLESSGTRLFRNVVGTGVRLTAVSLQTPSSFSSGSAGKGAGSHVSSRLYQKIHKKMATKCRLTYFMLLAPPPPNRQRRRIRRIISQRLWESWPDNILTLSVSHSPLKLRIFAGISISLTHCTDVT